MKILAIETSCDETSIALLKCNGTLKAPKFKILKNIVSSQIMVHREFGGVVPNLAKREHIKNLPKIFNNIKLKTYNLKLIDYISAMLEESVDSNLFSLWFIDGAPYYEKIKQDRGIRNLATYIAKKVVSYDKRL